MSCAVHIRPSAARFVVVQTRLCAGAGRCMAEAVTAEQMAVNIRDGDNDT